MAKVDEFLAPIDLRFRHEIIFKLRHFFALEVFFSPCLGIVLSGFFFLLRIGP